MTQATDHITKSLEELQAKGITSWPAAVVALLYKFGWGFGAVLGLIMVLGFISWSFWGHLLAQQKETNAVRVEQIADLRKAGDEKAVLVKATAEALTQSAEANSKLAKSLDELTGELRQSRYRNSTP